MGIISEFIKKERKTGKKKEEIAKELEAMGTDKTVIKHQLAKTTNRNIAIYSLIAAIIIMTIMLVTPLFKKDRCTDDNCYARLAMEKDSTRYCQKINNEVYKEACTSRLWTINDCVYMERTGYRQEEIDECRRNAFIQSLR